MATTKFTDEKLRIWTDVKTVNIHPVKKTKGLNLKSLRKTFDPFLLNSKHSMCRYMEIPCKCLSANSIVYIQNSSTYKSDRIIQLLSNPYHKSHCDLQIVVYQLYE